MIISGPADKPTDCTNGGQIIPRLKKEEDFTIDEKQNLVTLTDAGISGVEKMLGIEQPMKNMEISHHVNQALKTHNLMKRVGTM